MIPAEGEKNLPNYVLVLHIIVCFALIGLVLLQSGKEGMGVIFGGGSNSFFGAGGASRLLVRATSIAAAIFFITSLGYNYLNKSKMIRESSIMDAPIVYPVINKLDIPAVEIEASVVPASPTDPDSVPIQTEKKF
ncbi:preprotein translocase subunit SecG [Desulfovibrionales bacterium]